MSKLQYPPFAQILFTLFETFACQNQSLTPTLISLNVVIKISLKAKKHTFFYKNSSNLMMLLKKQFKDL